MKKKKNLFLMMVFSTIFLFGIVQAASAIFWGFDGESTTDWADGTCAYRQTCGTYYVFWIPVSSGCEPVETIGCID